MKDRITLLISEVYTKMRNRLHCFMYDHDTIDRPQDIPNIKVSFKPHRECIRCGKRWQL